MLFWGVNMKKTLLSLLLIFAIMFGINNVKAEFIQVSNATDLKAYFNAGGEVILTDDITFTANTGVNKDITVDLNGHTINMSNKTLVPYATITVMDSSTTQNGKITGTASFVIQIGSTSRTGGLILNSGTIEGNGSYGVRNFGNLVINGGSITGKAFVIYNQKDFTVNGGSVIASTGIAVSGNDNSTFVLNDGLIKTNGDDIAINLGKPGAKFTMNGGKVEALYENLPRSGGVGVMAYKDTEVVINGGEITAFSHGMGSNGSIDGSSAGTNAKFTINGGAITSINAPAMYIPQVNGQTVITGGTLTGVSAIEIRAGSLEITGGTFNSNSSIYESASNTNGSTTKGSSISVVQHLTKQPIYVHISGGTYNAVVPVSQTNPENNSEEDIRKVTIIIDNDNSVPIFNSTDPEKTIYSENLLAFIRGGAFTKRINNYIDPDYVELEENGIFVVHKLYNVLLNTNKNGKTTISKQKYISNEEVIINIQPYEDALIFVLDATDESGNKISINENKFIMPESDVNLRTQYLKAIVNEIDISKPVSSVTIGVTDKELAKRLMYEALIQDPILFALSVNIDPTLELVIREMEMTAEDRNKMLEAIQTEDAVVLKTYDIYVEVKDSDGNILGAIRNLPEELIFAIVMPEDVATVKKNYKRKYIIVESSEGYQVLDPDVKDNVIKFKTNKLSSYTTIYTDKKIDKDVLPDQTVIPDTKDNIIYYFMIFTFCLIVMNVYVIKRFLN